VLELDATPASHAAGRYKVAAVLLLLALALYLLVCHLVLRAVNNGAALLGLRYQQEQGSRWAARAGCGWSGQSPRSLFCCISTRPGVSSRQAGGGPLRPQARHSRGVLRP
jgi:hypothetical protein